MQGGGVGFFRDEHEADPSKRFKAFGGGTGRQGPGGVSACFGPGGNTHCISGTGTSPDGLVWSNATVIKWPAPQRCACPTHAPRRSLTHLRVLSTDDCHNNLFWVSRLAMNTA